MDAKFVVELWVALRAREVLFGYFVDITPCVATILSCICFIVSCFFAYLIIYFSSDGQFDKVATLVIRFSPLPRVCCYDLLFV